MKTNEMKLPSLNQLILIGAVAVAAFAIWTFGHKVSQPGAGETVELEPAREAVGTTKIVVPTPKVIHVYPDKIKDKLGLPEPVKADDNKKVVATGKLEAERPYTLSSVLDTSTGESAVYARPDPLPWVGPGTQGAVGVAYGMKNGQMTGRLYARHDLVRVKALHAGAIGMLDQDGDWFAGGYVEYRF